jgi:hypothetical protein
MSKLIEEMKRRGKGFFDLEEFDEWVNDITREELKQFGEGYFGLEFWTWKVYEAPFTDVKNFQFSMVFRNEDKEKVFEIIEKYKRKEIDARECVHRISNLAVYHCIWV